MVQKEDVQFFHHYCSGEIIKGEKVEEGVCRICRSFCNLYEWKKMKERDYVVYVCFNGVEAVEVKTEKVNGEIFNFLGLNCDILEIKNIKVDFLCYFTKGGELKKLPSIYLNCTIKEEKLNNETK